MTPRDALAAALCDPGNLEPWEVGHDDGHMATADSILAALDAAGWTVAPKQDPLERMADLTVPQGLTFDVVPEVARGALYGWTVRIFGPSSIVAAATRPTIAAAADAAREALEAGR